MGKLVISEKAKDRTLNIVLLVCVLLFITGFVRPKPNTRANTPVNSEYSVLKLDPISLGKITQFEEATLIENTNQPTLVQSSTQDITELAPKNTSLPKSNISNISPKPSQTRSVTNTLNKTIYSVTSNLF